MAEPYGGCTMDIKVLFNAGFWSIFQDGPHYQRLSLHRMVQHPIMNQSSALPLLRHSRSGKVSDGLHRLALPAVSSTPMWMTPLRRENPAAPAAHLSCTMSSLEKWRLGLQRQG